MVLICSWESDYLTLNINQPLENGWELKKLKKFNELQSVEDVTSGEVETESQLELFYTDEWIRYLLVKSQQFPISVHTKGVIMYKKHINYSLALSGINTESILENMTDAFFLLDQQMNFYYLNSESEKVLQRSREKLIGRNIWACFPEAVGSKFYTNYNKAMKDRITVEFEEYFPPLNSWFSIKACPIEKKGISVYYRKIKKEDETKALLPRNPYNDYLTKCLNRWKFEEKMEGILQNNNSFSILYLNLDNFKHINKIYNHDVGDKVIRFIANSLGNMALPHELVGRLDGDELIFLHFHQTQEEVEKQIERIKEIFAQPIVLGNGPSVKVNASIGVASYPEDSYSAEELISFAETAMRTAKKRKGTSHVFFTSVMGVNLARRLTIEKSLAGDLDSLGFHFAIQPQVHCETGELTGGEVLARWNHPTLGFLSPVEFIGIAEETGTISRLTHCLLKSVFCFLKKLNENGLRIPKTAINVTPSLLTSQLFFDDLYKLMEEYDIPSEWIELEITESVELTYSEVTLNNLLACRAKGISIALDDFGTGFSMLAYLMDYPIDKIKLDKSFVSKIGHDAKSEAVLTSLIQFVKGIKCELLAEGVETIEESAFLQENGCVVHQGYYYDKPLAPESFITKYLSIPQVTE